MYREWSRTDTRFETGLVPALRRPFRSPSTMLRWIDLKSAKTKAWAAADVSSHPGSNDVGESVSFSCPAGAVLIIQGADRALATGWRVPWCRNQVAPSINGSLGMMEAQDELRLELMHARTELAFLLSDQVPGQASEILNVRATYQSACRCDQREWIPRLGWISSCQCSREDDGQIVERSLISRLCRAAESLSGPRKKGISAACSLTLVSPGGREVKESSLPFGCAQDKLLPRVRNANISKRR